MMKAVGYLVGRVLRARSGGATQWLRCSTPFLSRGTLVCGYLNLLDVIINEYRLQV